MVLWFRMFIHYMGQYLIIKFMDAPVISLKFGWTKIYVEYAVWRVEHEMMVISAGPLCNTGMFFFFALVCYLSQRWVYCFPVIFCKIIAWHGLLTVMDFAFIVVVDTAH